MAITHAGFDVPGTHENFRMGDWGLDLQFNKPFGTDGATLLYGGRSLRPIDVKIMIWDGYTTSDELNEFLETLERQIGEIGDLVELGNVERSFANVAYLGFSLEEGPIPPNPSKGWLDIGVLHFLQLGPADVT